jgi:hypothetical protein
VSIAVSIAASIAAEIFGSLHVGSKWAGRSVNTAL